MPKMAAGQVALVTGATRGIGKAIALDLSVAGFRVVVAGRTLRAGQGRHDVTGSTSPAPGSIEETVQAIEAAGGEALGVRLDLLDRDSIDAAIAAVKTRFGRLDVLVNNGIYQGPVVMQPIAEIEMQAAEASLLGNVVNQLYLSRAAIKFMLPARAGRLIFVTTRATERPATGSCGLMYSAGKAAFNKLPDFIQFEYGKDGIAAFLIEPQFTMTDTLRSRLGAEAERVGQGYNPRDPKETARTVTWLASSPDASRFAGAQMINAPDFFADQRISPL
jgi:3-oxoacyl-[acyl-carrier protein] reductase